MKLILASQSPRRKELLEWLGLEFEVVPSNFDERSVEEEDVVELSEELALQKALTVAKQYPDAIIVSADTLVELNGEILGKADNREQALETISKLCGSTHRVVTAVCVLNSLTGEKRVGHEQSFVTFRPSDPEEINRYLDTAHWQDKAGAYALQEDPMKFVVHTEGSHSNIIGLPLKLTSDLLTEFGFDYGVNVEKVMMSQMGVRD